jgi:hypothetical protein
MDMTTREFAWGAISATLVAALVFQGAASAHPRQATPPDNSGPRARTAVISLQDCMDRTLNTWVADNEAEVRKVQEAESGRANDLTPQERLRIRTKITDLSNRLKLETYAEIVRMSGIVARERGFDLVQKVERMPVFESGEPDLGVLLDRRAVVSFSPEIDITREVLDRINRDRGARKK